MIRRLNSTPYTPKQWRLCLILISYSAPAPSRRVRLQRRLLDLLCCLDHRAQAAKISFQQSRQALHDPSQLSHHHSLPLPLDFTIASVKWEFGTGPSPAAQPKTESDSRRTSEDSVASDVVMQDNVAGSSPPAGISTCHSENLTSLDKLSSLSRLRRAHRQACIADR